MQSRGCCGKERPGHEDGKPHHSVCTLNVNGTFSGNCTQGWGNKCCVLRATNCSDMMGELFTRQRPPLAFIFIPMKTMWLASWGMKRISLWVGSCMFPVAVMASSPGIVKNTTSTSQNFLLQRANMSAGMIQWQLGVCPDFTMDLSTSPFLGTICYSHTAKRPGDK